MLREMHSEAEALPTANTHSESGGASFPVARAETLTGFVELVTSLGGDARAMLRRAQIAPAVLDDPNGLIPLRAMVHLMEHAAHDLDCPDFGIRLAAAQGPGKIFSPVGVAMRNSATLGAALGYCVDHVHVYSNAMRMSFADAGVPGTRFLHFEIVHERLPHQQQVVEHTLALMHHATPQLSGGRARVREIWFAHAPGADERAYRRHFGARIRFEQPMNGVLFDERDLTIRLPDMDRQLYELATGYIDARFPSADNRLTLRVRTLIGRMLREEDCSLEKVAAALGMHPRTLQRRLREEGESFEVVRDGVRREAALQMLRQTRVPLIHVAEALGYSEVSTLSRSCYRWFAASPRRLRSADRHELAETGPRA